MPHAPLHTRKKWQNIAILLGIAGFSLLVLVITLVKLSGNVASP